MKESILVPIDERGRLIHVNCVICDPKEYFGHRVVTFKDIDLVHGRAEGTARKG